MKGLVVLVYLVRQAIAQADTDPDPAPEPPAVSTDTDAAAEFTATIPPSTGNPFIQSSALPEGLVFIAVGSVLGLLLVSLLLWRIVSFYQLRASAKHSEVHFSALDQGFSHTAEDEGTATLAPVKQNRNAATSMTQTAQIRNRKSLFFSPTEEAMTRQTMDGPMLSSTSYLPSGYYGGERDTMSSAHAPLTDGRVGGRRQLAPSAYLDDLLR